MNVDLEKLDVAKAEDRAVLWGAGVPIEVWSEGGHGWYIVTNIAQLSTHLWSRKFRLKPITRTITIPQCLTEAPKIGSFLWGLNVYIQEGYFRTIWEDSHIDRVAIRNGGYFATEDDVKAVVAAMRGAAK